MPVVLATPEAEMGGIISVWPGVRGCSELWLSHCITAWETVTLCLKTSKNVSAGQGDSHLNPRALGSWDRRIVSGQEFQTRLGNIVRLSLKTKNLWSLVASAHSSSCSGGWGGRMAWTWEWRLQWAWVTQWNIVSKKKKRKFSVDLCTEIMEH